MKSSNTPERFSSPPVLDLVGIAENFTFQADPVGLLRELLTSAGMTLQNPAGIMAANARLLWGSAAAFRAAVARALGYDRPGPIAIPRGDKRFSDPAYQQNPAYFMLAQQYLLFSNLLPTSSTRLELVDREKPRPALPLTSWWMRWPRLIRWPATPQRSARLSTRAA